MVVLEAKSVGTPSLVAVAANSAAKDLVVSGSTGVLFPVDDLECATQIIAPYLLRPERLRQMRPAVMSDALVYSHRQVAQTMLEAYDK
jgi:glycosyltransferase involved in cell wall biosynthesis